MFYKKRNIIEIDELENGIVCDNEVCDYVIPKSEMILPLESYVNKPCPKCGENLLTEKDYKLSINFKKIVNIINFLFSWMTIFKSPEKDNYTYRKASFHDKIKFEKEDDNN